MQLSIPAMEVFANITCMQKFDNYLRTIFGAATAHASNVSLDNLTSTRILMCNLANEINPCVKTQACFLSKESTFSH